MYFNYLNTIQYYQGFIEEYILVQLIQFVNLSVK